MSSKAQQGAPPSRTGGKRPQVTIQLNATPSAPGDDAGGESGYYVPGTGADVSTAEFSKIVAAQLVGAGGGSGEELPALAGGGAAVGGGGGGGANEAAAAAALPNLDYGVLEDVVHATVWDVGRLVGFQAFNVNPSTRGAALQEHVPATIFVASDHLCRLLVRDMWLRDRYAAVGGGVTSRETRFAHVVHQLHASIFRPYATRWCRLVGLKPRPTRFDEVLASHAFDHPRVVSGLLCELGLWFLTYTEVANLRHAPEAIWFVYNLLSHDPLLDARRCGEPPERVAGGRDKRVKLRNVAQGQIAETQRALGHDPSSPAVRPEACSLYAAAVFEHLAAAQAAPDVESLLLLADLAALGDGGFVTDRLVAPLFYFLSHEMDAMFNAGEEIAFRVGYDDVNESLCRQDVVSATLGHLKVKRDVLRAGGCHDGWFNLTRLGCDAGGSGAEETFDAQRAADFWSAKVFVKTYRERRSWWAIYRAYYRVYALHFVLIHLMLATAFEPWNLKVLSSVVLTHAFFAFLERHAAWHMTRWPADPLDKAAAAAEWVSGGGGKDGSKGGKMSGGAAASAKRGGKGGPSAAADGPPSPRTVRKQRRKGLRLEGSPWLGVFGYVEWLLLFLGLTAAYVLQWLEVTASPLAKLPWLATVKDILTETMWLYIAGGYVALVVLHDILTTRDGYTVSLTHALRLPAIFSAHSARPRATHWVDGPLAIGWGVFFVQSFFWGAVLCIKVLFDYFVIIKPIPVAVDIILQRDWLGCSTRTYTFGSWASPLPCIGGSWLLIAIRVTPPLLVCIFDTQVVYNLVLTAFGLTRGVMKLELGVIKNWDDLTREFWRGPTRWWGKCMSATGNTHYPLIMMAEQQASEATSDAGSELTQQYAEPLDASYAAAGYDATYQQDFATAAADGIGGSGGTFVRRTVTAGAAEQQSLESPRVTLGMRRANSLHEDLNAAGSGLPPLSPGAHGAAAYNPAVPGVGGGPRRTMSVTSTGSALPSPRPGSSLSRGRTSDSGVNYGFASTTPPTSPSGAATAAADKRGGGSGKGGGKRSSSASRAAARAATKKANSPSIMALLSSEDAEQIAMWHAFGAAWDEIVEDLREADLVSDAEVSHLRFIRLGHAAVASGLRTLLLPTFFYAGQIRRVVDALPGRISSGQIVVLTEFRYLVVWLGVELGLLSATAVKLLMELQLATDVVDLSHADWRSKLFAAGCRLVDSLHSLCDGGASSGASLQSLAKSAGSALIDVLSALEVECRAVAVSIKGRGSSAVKMPPAPRAGGGSGKAPPPPQQSAATLAFINAEVAKQLEEALSEVKKELRDQPDQLASRLFVLLPPAAGGPTDDAYLDSRPADTELLVQVVGVLHRMLRVSPQSAQPSSAEARRVLSFFMNTLGNPQLPKPPPVDQMLSLSVLTPCYEEDVLYPLDARRAVEALGLRPPPPPSSSSTDGSGGGHGGGLPTDLLTESEDRVSLMAYLRSVFPKDWDNFRERLGRRLGLDPSRVAALTEADFGEGGTMAAHGLELQLWASFRGQLLARTVRGMMCHDKALRILTRMEYPRPTGMSHKAYAAWMDKLVSSKFEYIVSAQVYGRNRSSSDPRAKWLAKSTEVTLQTFNKLKVAFLDSAPGPGGPANYSVLIRSRNGAQLPEWQAQLHAAAGLAPGSNSGGSSSGGKLGRDVVELYRVRLPANRYTSRSVIIGEGKPENQNHAIIFAFGEALQAIDMNQDNNVAEALKMRCLLTELLPTPASRGLFGCCGGRSAAASSSLGPPAKAQASAAKFQASILAAREREVETSMVGHREWIFSDRAGALGSFAASAEFAFGTIVQRTMSYPGRVRFHYGHPDVFNKVALLTKGGMSKATRQLHISEDVMGGYNHVLRGGAIKYREYISVGKGRDMGFDSINAFEIKISGGAGEVVLSRETFRLATRFDVFRCMHFYYSGLGHYINILTLMAVVQASIFSLVIFAFVKASFRRVAVIDSDDPNQNIKGYDVIEPVQIEQLLQIGSLVILPYVGQLVQESGPVRALVTVLMQVVSGSLAFFVFKQQTTAYYFYDDITYGGARYIGTGRGFSITTSQFVKLFANYSRSHLYLGAELVFHALVLFIVGPDCAECSYAGVSWGTWLVACSLLLSPFWFNPLTFSTTKVKRDFHDFSAWLRGEIDPGTGSNWYAWNRKQLEKVRNDRGAQTDHWANVLSQLALSCVPPVLLALAAVSTLELRIEKAPVLLQSPYVVFAIATAAIWTAAAMSLALRARSRTTARSRSWHVYQFWLGATLVALLAAYFLVSAFQLFDGNPFGSFLILVYANFNLLLALHRAMTHLCTRGVRGRAAVDAGFWLIDCAIGYLLLLVLAILSLVGIVARIQATLLFNVTFAKSVRRGKLVKTMGLQKEQQQQQAASSLSSQQLLTGGGGSTDGQQLLPAVRRTVSGSGASSSR